MHRVMQLLRKHPIVTALVAALILVLAVTAVRTLAGERKVKVRVGLQTKCEYGEVLYSTVHSLWVPESKAKDYRVYTNVVLCEKHRLARLYYQRGQALAKKGKYAEALKSFKAAAKAEPGFADVGTWVASGGKRGTPGGGDTGGTGDPGGTGNPDDPGGGGSPPTDIAKLIPETIPGYDTRGFINGKTEASREYEPVDKQAIPARVLIVRTYDRGSDAEAAKFISSVSKRVYPNNAKTINYSRMGVKAYFGTGQSLYATFAWAKGRVVRELLMESTTNQPEDLYKAINSAANKVN